MFKIPTITKNLLIINVLAYFATSLLAKNIDLNNILGLHFFMADRFMPHQLITYMFMHGGFEHLFFNMFTLWMFGRIMEQYWGAKKFLIFYMVCGIGAGLCQEAVQYIQYVSEGLANYSVVTNGDATITMSQYLDLWTTVGASGAIYGILLGFGMTFPNHRILLIIPPIPIKAKYLVIGFALIELFSGMAYSQSNVAHFAHLGGMLFGLVLILYWRHKSGVNSNGFSNWTEYKPKKNFWDKFKREPKGPKYTGSKKSSNSSSTRGTYTSYTETSSSSSASGSSSSKPTEMEERRAKQAEIDRILDKVKKSGYSCLTEEEKKTIFEFRNK